MARHISLSIPLNQISDEDDVEIILRSSQTGAPIHGPVRLDALRLKTLVVSTLANGASIGATNWTADDAGKYMLFEIARGSNVNGQLFLHDTLYIGRVDNSTLVMWTGASTGKWEYVSRESNQRGVINVCQIQPVPYAASKRDALR